MDKFLYRGRDEDVEVRAQKVKVHAGVASGFHFPQKQELQNESTVIVIYIVYTRDGDMTVYSIPHMAM